MIVKAAFRDFLERNAPLLQDIPSKEILEATRELLIEILSSNEIDDFADLASMFLTTTPDLTSAFPAEAARELGMHKVPLLCASEIAVPGAMPRCIRVLLHINIETPQGDVTHVYLREARKLRPDVNSAQ